MEVSWSVKGMTNMIQLGKVFDVDKTKPILNILRPALDQT